MSGETIRIQIDDIVRDATQKEIAFIEAIRAQTQLPAGADSVPAHDQ